MTRLERARRFFLAKARPGLRVISLALLAATFSAAHAKADSISHFNPTTDSNGHVLATFGGGYTVNPNFFSETEGTINGVEGLGIYGSIGIICNNSGLLHPNGCSQAVTITFAGTVTGPALEAGDLSWIFSPGLNGAGTGSYGWSIGGMTGSADWKSQSPLTGNGVLTLGDGGTTWSFTLEIDPDVTLAVNDGFHIFIPSESTFDLSGTQDQTVTTPEPGSILLMFSGASVLLGLRRKRLK